MIASVILTISGCDRPGLTRAMAEAVTAAGGNWLESHLASLRGLYVGSVLVELPAERMDELRQSVASIDQSGLQVAIVGAGPNKVLSGDPMTVAVIGQDRPGIVREVTSALASREVNIESFESSVESSAWSGARLFRATAQVRIPAGTSEESLREALEAISGEIIVDLTPVLAREHLEELESA